MKKHYEKMCMTPLDFMFEGNLLEGSVIDDMAVTSMGQKVEEINAQTEWSTEWEW